LELFATFIDIILHLDRHLIWLVQNYGGWIYLILFLIIFCETGLVVMPFLPGDSLLFVAGAIAATGAMEVQWLAALLMLAAFCGDNTNYWIGRYLGPRIFASTNSRLLNRADWGAMPCQPKQPLPYRRLLSRQAGTRAAG
jgi:membrane-associated protein